MNRITNLGDTIISHNGSFGRNIGPPAPPPPPPQQAGFMQQPKVVIAQNPGMFNVDDYIKYRYPFKFAILHVGLLIFLNVVVMTLQTVLTLKNASYPNVYAGFWAGGVNVFVGLVTIFSVCVRSYLVISLLAGFHFISIVITIIGLIILSIFALSFYDNCPLTNQNVACLYTAAIPINWTIFAIGIASTILSGIFFSVLMALIGGVFSKRSDYTRK